MSKTQLTIALNRGRILKEFLPLMAAAGAAGGSRIAVCPARSRQQALAQAEAPHRVFDTQCLVRRQDDCPTPLHGCGSPAPSTVPDGHCLPQLVPLQPLLQVAQVGPAQCPSSAS